MPKVSILLCLAVKYGSTISASLANAMVGVSNNTGRLNRAPSTVLKNTWFRPFPESVACTAGIIDGTSIMFLSPFPITSLEQRQE